MSSNTTLCPEPPAVGALASWTRPLGSYLATAWLMMALTAAVLLAGCGSLQVGPAQTVPPATDIRRVAPQQAERLYAIMVPLLAAMDKPLKPSQVHVGVMDDLGINAANAGGGNFYVTAGLLRKANERQLRGIMAHEIAHEDLGHVAQMQALGAGLSIGAQLLDQFLPGSGAITPIAGALISRGYSRSEESKADRHAVDILRRAGYSKDTLIDALTWVERTSGGGGGGFLATHPATSDRIDALKGLAE